MQGERLWCLFGLLLANTSIAAPAFVNGIALSGSAVDLSGGDKANTGRVGYFSDLYYDPTRSEWWGLSDRGPGGGTINYDTRVQRFTIDIDMNSGAISNFKIAQTVTFTDPNNVLGAGPGALNGLAPATSSVLGRSFDPEGFVVNARTGNLLVSDEYGPSLYEFDRSGVLLRQFTTPDKLVPKAGAKVNYTATPQNGSSPQLTSGREGNRGFEGLAISPDGKYAYAVLQNGTIEDGYNPVTGTRGRYSRIVKFDTATGLAVAQYAYLLESSAQGRGISAIVAINDHEFLVLERNNRGVGIGANPASPDKNVFKIDLTGAVDVSSISLPAGPTFTGAVVNNPTKFIDLDADTLAALGNKSPEKWEGLSIGPRLNDGSYAFLAGTDNDYSVTQDGSGTQFDVYLDFTLADPYASSIQCPLDATAGCFLTTGGAAATLTSSYALLPGVLHSYKVGATDIPGYQAPVSEPAPLALLLAGLGILGGLQRRQGGQRRAAGRAAA